MEPKQIWSFHFLRLFTFMEHYTPGLEIRITISHSTQHEIDLIACQLADLLLNGESVKNQ